MTSFPLRTFLGQLARQIKSHLITYFVSCWSHWCTLTASPAQNRVGMKSRDAGSCCDKSVVSACAEHFNSVSHKVYFFVKPQLLDPDDEVETLAFAILKNAEIFGLGDEILNSQREGWVRGPNVWLNLWS